MKTIPNLTALCLIIIIINYYIIRLLYQQLTAAIEVASMDILNCCVGGLPKRSALAKPLFPVCQCVCHIIQST